MTPTMSMRRRGSALLTVMLLVAILAMLGGTLLLIAQNQMIASVNTTRTFPRNYCLDTGLQMARSYYGANFACWSKTCTTANAPGGFLLNMGIYNPVVASYNPVATAANPSNSPSGYLGTAWVATESALGAHPELFADLDGDGIPDVYIYIRDNQDEIPSVFNPTLGDMWYRDEDEQVYIGAVCISPTLAPRLSNGLVNPAMIQEEMLYHHL